MKAASAVGADLQVGPSKKQEIREKALKDLQPVLDAFKKTMSDKYPDDLRLHELFLKGLD